MMITNASIAQRRTAPPEERTSKFRLQYQDSFEPSLRLMDHEKCVFADSRIRNIQAKCYTITKLLEEIAILICRMT